MSRLEKFAQACAEYLVENDYDSRQYGYAETYQNAIDNTNDLWNYLWSFGEDDGRKICEEYWDVLRAAPVPTY